jgi:hypothetical protein
MIEEDEGPVRKRSRLEKLVQNCKNGALTEIKEEE